MVFFDQLATISFFYLGPKRNTTHHRYCNNDKPINLLIIGNKLFWFKTKCGYLKEKVMLFWLNNIYLPYINYAKSQIENETALFLLFLEGLKAHLTVRVNHLLESNCIDILVFPPNSSYLVLCLDLYFFGIMKKHYKICRSQLFQGNNRKSQRIERILKSFYTASIPTIIYSGWKASGIDITFENGKYMHIYFLI